MPLTVLVCGSGNAGHVLASLASSHRSWDCRVLTLSQADRWNKALSHKRLTCSFPTSTCDMSEVYAKPSLITNNPAQAVIGADVILLSVPAYSHGQYLKAIEPFILKPTILIALPGQPGFEFQMEAILGDKLLLLSVMSAETLPWACRIINFGVHVKVIATKQTVTVAIARENKTILHNPVHVLQTLVGLYPVLQVASHYLELSPKFSAQHTAIMYGKWRDWNLKSVQERPLFYQGMNEMQAKYLSQLFGEVDAVLKSFTKNGLTTGADVSARHQWLIDAYGSAVVDTSTLMSAFITNKAYANLVHPMKATDGGYVPDFKSRYLTEDVPYTMVVLKGLAALSGLATPVIDTIITWCQDKLGKSYMVGCELKGKHLHETRAPQVYGINSLEDLTRFNKKLGLK